MKCSLYACVLLACGGSSTPPDSASTPREVVTDDKALLVGELAEGILTGGPSDLVKVHLASPTPTLDWNLHGHAGGSTETVIEELGVTTVDYEFQPSAQGDWFLLIRNKDTAPQTIAVQLELFGDVVWNGWQ